MTAKLFESALGITDPWFVASLDFDEGAKLLTQPALDPATWPNKQNLRLENPCRQIYALFDSHPLAEQMLEVSRSFAVCLGVI